MTIFERIQQIMAIKKISQAELARRLNVTPQTITAYFRQKDMTINLLKKIAAALDAPFTTFLEEAEQNVLQEPDAAYGISKDEIIILQREKIERLEAKIKHYEKV